MQQRRSSRRRSYVIICEKDPVRGRTNPAIRQLSLLLRQTFAALAKTSEESDF
jgi:hypothetical protein